MATTTTARRVKVTGDMFHGRVPDGAVYIGRQMPGLTGSPWANPYSVKRYGRERALELFSAYLDAQPELVQRARRELRDQTMACWCDPTDPSAKCHGDEWARRIYNQESTP